MGRFGPEVTRQLRLGTLMVRLVAAVAAITAATVLAGKVLLTPKGDGLVQPFDDAVRVWTLAHLHALHPVAALLGAIGSTPAIVAASLLLTVLLWQRTGDASRALLPALAVIVATVVGACSKFLVGRVRPGGVSVGLLEAYSFPSGHTEAATALAIGLWWTWRAGRSPRGIRLAAVLVAITVVVVAVGRVVLDVHWATDVIAGVVVGVTGAVAARWALEGARRMPAVDPTVIARDR